jgi:hypothetical protein
MCLLRNCGEKVRKSRNAKSNLGPMWLAANWFRALEPLAPLCNSRGSKTTQAAILGTPDPIAGFEPEEADGVSRISVEAVRCMLG